MSDSNLGGGDDNDGDEDSDVESSSYQLDEIDIGPTQETPLSPSLTSSLDLRMDHVPIGETCKDYSHPSPITFSFLPCSPSLSLPIDYPCIVSDPCCY